MAVATCTAAAAAVAAGVDSLPSNIYHSAVTETNSWVATFPRPASITGRGKIALHRGEEERGMSWTGEIGWRWRTFLPPRRVQGGFGLPIGGLLFFNATLMASDCPNLACHCMKRIIMSTTSAAPFLCKLSFSFLT